MNRREERARARAWVVVVLALGAAWVAFAGASAGAPVSAAGRHELRPQLVKDIHPGAGDSYCFNGVIEAGGALFFAATDGVTGCELWKTTGTAGRTVLVSDINPGAGDSDPQAFAVVGESLFFSADDGVTGGELWRHDLVTGQTRLAADLRDGWGSFPDSLTPVGDDLFFAANDGVHGLEVWHHDPATGQTALVHDIGGDNPNTTSVPKWLTPLGGKLYFVADGSAQLREQAGYELWVHDPETGATEPVPTDNVLEATDPRELTVVGGRLLFSGYGDTTGQELWVHDPADGTTTLVEDINPGLVELAFRRPAGSYPLAITPIGDEAFFTADDGTHGRELWKTDGTAAGTVLVADVWSGPGNAFGAGLWSAEFVAGNGKVFFAANDGRGTELWAYDPRSGETGLVQNLNGAYGSIPSGLAFSNGTLFFSAYDSASGTELWASDGTATGTTLVADLNPGVYASHPTDITALAGTVYFAATDGATGMELWRLR